MDKQFKLSFPDGRSILTCNLRGAQFLPAHIVLDANLDALGVGEDTATFDAHDNVFIWERIA